MDDDAIAQALEQRFPHWRREGHTITRSVEAPSFLEGIDLVGVIARAAARKSPALARAASPCMTGANFDASSGSPITPVEARKISAGLQPVALAAISAVSLVAARPLLPVKALALPELTTSARALPDFR